MDVAEPCCPPPPFIYEYNFPFTSSYPTPPHLWYVQVVSVPFRPSQKEEKCIKKGNARRKMAVVAPANADIVHILTLFEAKFEANNNEQQVFIV